MARYVIATTKSWNLENARILIQRYSNHEFCVIVNKTELTKSFLDEYQPKIVFFPHWSWIIPEEIYDNYDCVVFHMTDLPFGRGGSPLQNLIVRGIYQTKISALKVTAGIDAGPVYFKEPVDISEGSAEEIFQKVSGIIFREMIPRFLTNDLFPEEQSGEPVCFSRRKPEESEIPDRLTQRQIYDYIRMLDGEGYPTAFKRYDHGKTFFSNAFFENGVVTATARFVEDQPE